MRLNFSFVCQFLWKSTLWGKSCQSIFKNGDVKGTYFCETALFWFYAPFEVFIGSSPFLRFFTVEREKCETVALLFSFCLFIWRRSCQQSKKNTLFRLNQWTLSSVCLYKQVKHNISMVICLNGGAAGCILGRLDRAVQNLPRCSNKCPTASILQRTSTADIKALMRCDELFLFSFLSPNLGTSCSLRVITACPVCPS